MILGFSTQLNGKPTYFVERIWEGLMRNIFEDDIEYQQYLKLHKKQFSKYWDWFPDGHPRVENPKLHTLRDDPKDRWKAGMMIDFFINVRTKKMFRFAPKVPVVSTQRVSIKYNSKGHPIVTIDDKCFYMQGFSLEGNHKMLHLAQNDGFDTIEDFFAYFDKDFSGKIIHWTDLKY
jgi:hypothetical protein